MAYEPLHHKYRPQTFAQLVGQDAIATTLSNALEQRRIAPAYLFCGPRGTGKTSSARILAKSLNCLSQDRPTSTPCGTCEVCRSITQGSALDFVEIDAASNTGVDNIRELIERAQFAPVQCRYKVYVIDECHMLSTAAFNALLKTLEEPPSSVVFVLATTDPQRVLPTIISRCQRFDYRRIPLEPMIGHLRNIADQETIDINDEALRLVAQVSQGGLRDAQSLLDQLSLLEPPIQAEAVWDLVGAVPERDLLALVQGLLSDDSTAVLDQVRNLMDRGREPLIVLQNLAGFYRDLLIAKTAGQRHDLVAITPPTWAEMQALVQNLEPSQLLLSQQQLRTAEVQVKHTTQPRLWLEVTLLGLLPSALTGQTGPVVAPSGLSAPARRPLQATPPASATPVSPPAAPAPAIPPDVPSPPAANAPAPSPASPPAPGAELPPPDPDPPLVVPPVPNVEPEPAADPSLEQLWNQVIAVLQPLGTRALMQQQGSLLFFDGVVARVGISSRPLFKMAQGRVDNVEAAFLQVLEKKVQVSLEVLPDPKPEEPAPAHPLTPMQGSPQAWGSAPLPPEPPAPGLDSDPPAPSPLPASPGATPTPDRNDGRSVTPPLPEIATDFDRAVKTFAQFFNGQVVDLDDDLDTKLKEGRLSPSDAAANQPAHPDKDVPF
ncbi:MAG: DNA polymerase III subunit gamma/tau [Nodosilinea sp.]